MTGRPPDQRDLWAAEYQLRSHRHPGVSAFAQSCLPLLEPGSTILELGCGGGADAEAFAKAGHTVTATDFVPAVIDANRERVGPTPNLRFETMRIDEPYPYPDSRFDAVYAHLTLHYFTHDITRAIVAEIRRVLKPGGWLMFACKSLADPACGKGVELEPNMFDFHGKVRHFFSEDYARQLLLDEFTDIRTTSHTGKLYSQRAAWITAIARAT